MGENCTTGRLTGHLKIGVSIIRQFPLVKRKDPINGLADQGKVKRFCKVGVKSHIKSFINI